MFNIFETFIRRKFLSVYLHINYVEVPESEPYVTTYGHKVTSWNKAPIWRLRPDFYYCQTVAGLLIWGALSDERTGLSFTIVAGLHQCSHSRVRVFWDSKPYFTVSDSRLPFSSFPTTRRAMVEVFDPRFHTGTSCSYNKIIISTAWRLMGEWKYSYISLWLRH
jgi:hypothetical protein